MTALRLFGIALLAVSCTQQLTQRRGVFISLDGLNPNYVHSLSQAGKLQGGLSTLDSRAVYSRQAAPVVTTITAASHVSTITCSPPATHGIVSNNFRRGDQVISGFDTEFSAEPLWKAAIRQGRRVLALAYVGADGRTPNRTATWGLAYPDPAKISQPQNVTLQAGEQKAVDVVLSPQTNERTTFYIRNTQDLVEVDIDQDSSNGISGTLRRQIDSVVDLYFRETQGGQLLRRVTLRWLDATRVYVSGASYNNAYPESYRTLLEERRLVWPNYGIKGDQTPAQKVASSSDVDRFLADVAAMSLQELPVDVLLYYQPLIDSVGHAWQEQLPKPFNPNANDEMTTQFVTAYQIIDRTLARVFNAAGPDAAIAVMGDHGMDGTKNYFNLAAFWPADERMTVAANVITSGGLGLIYGDLAAIDDELRQILAFEYRGALAVQKILRKAETDPWHWGEASAVLFANEGLAFEVNPGADERLTPPRIGGNHGHDLALSQMRTGLFFLTPEVQKQVDLGPVSLADAVPTFSEAIGLDPPANCQGQSLLGKLGTYD
jgi:predicted AlkP superfamily pyrophosphatase or phosphodiesterase